MALRVCLVDAGLGAVFFGRGALQPKLGAISACNVSALSRSVHVGSEFRTGLWESMADRTQLTARDEEILLALLSKVRVFSVEQIAKTWWCDSQNSKRAALRRLQRLSVSDLLSIRRVFVRPLPRLEVPLVSWRPRLPRPRFGPVAWQLQSRWDSPQSSTAICFATTTAAKRLGGLNRQLLNPLQVTHDLGTAEVYLQFRIAEPDKARRWVGEDMLRFAKGQKVPDALIEQADRRGFERAIEFGGAYDRRRLESFHRYCRKKALPYEIW